MNTATALEYLKEVRLQVEAAIELIQAGGLREDPRARAQPYDVIIGDFGVKAIRGEFCAFRRDETSGLYFGPIRIERNNIQITEMEMPQHVKDGIALGLKFGKAAIHRTPKDLNRSLEAKNLP